MDDPVLPYKKDTPTKRIDILLLKREEVLKYVQHLQEQRKNVFERIQKKKRTVAKAKKGTALNAIDKMLTSALKLLDEADACLAEATTILNKTRAVQLEMEPEDADAGMEEQV